MKKTNEPKKPGTKIDLGAMLVYGAAAFQAYHMGRAFHVYDPDGLSLLGLNIGGLLLGAILNVIVAQAAIHLPTISATFSSLKELLPKENKKSDKKEVRARAQALKKMLLAMKQNAYSQVGFYVLLAFSVVMVAPALYILWSTTLPFEPWFIGFMAVVGAIAPDVAITVGGFISSDAGSDDQRRSATRSVTVQGEQVAGTQVVQVTSKVSKLQGASSKQGVQVAGSKTSKLQVQARKQPVQDEALLAHWRDKPQASDRQVAEQFGTSRQAVQQRREKLIKQSAIRMTDKGVEIVGISVGYQAEVKQ